MKAYIFDLDGTILDSMRVWEQIDIDFLTKRGFAVPPDYINEICARSFPEAAEYTINRFGLTSTVEDLLREWNEMAVYAYGHTVAMKPYAKDYLQTLKSKNKKLAVATGLPEKLYTPALENNGIASLFDVVCSTDEVAFGKTKPDVFLLTAQKLGVKPENCVVFEDIPQAILSARQAGMRVIGVYDEASKQHWEQIQRIADSTIYSFNEAPVPQH